MGVLREEEFETFLKRRVSTMNGLLVHGADSAAVSMLARRMISSFSDTSQIDLGAAKSAPGGFMDQMLSLSLLGDRQLLFVDGADESCLKFLEPAFAQSSLCNFVLITADNLNKSSKLRAAAEASNLFACLAIYEEDGAALRERVRKLLAADGLSWTPATEDLFFDSVGQQRTIVSSEIEKLVTYAQGQKLATAEDVSAICGDVAGFEIDELVDAVLSGDLETTDRIFQALGSEQTKFFPLFALHLTRLQQMRAEMDEGGTLENVLRNARPPIFFKRKNTFAAQLRALSLENVVSIQEAVQAAVLQSRKLGDLSSAVTSRAILAITRQCRTKLSA
ncbi:MAG: DNA polymerase III subunit delta [Aestuariivirga sp.]